MQMTKKNILVTLFAIVSTVMFFFIVLGALKIYMPAANDGASDEKTATETSTVSIDSQDKISIQLAVTKPNPNKALTYGDKLSLTTRVKNISPKEVSYEFSSGCTGPDIYLNGSNIDPIRLCTQAFTTVTIQPQETIATDYSYTLIKDDGASAYLDMPYTDGDDQLHIEPGSYNTTTKWQDIESAPIRFIVAE